MDMAGFSVSVQLLRARPEATFPAQVSYINLINFLIYFRTYFVDKPTQEIQNLAAQVSYLEEGFVRSLGVSREELEPRADHCTRCVDILLRTE